MFTALAQTAQITNIRQKTTRKSQLSSKEIFVRFFLVFSWEFQQKLIQVFSQNFLQVLLLRLLQITDFFTVFVGNSCKILIQDFLKCSNRNVSTYTTRHSSKILSTKFSRIFISPQKVYHAGYKSVHLRNKSESAT